MHAPIIKIRSIHTPPSPFSRQSLHYPQHVSWDALKGPPSFVWVATSPGTHPSHSQLSAASALCPITHSSTRLRRAPRLAQLRLLTRVATHLPNLSAMASVQTAPNLPQGGAALPPNLNSAQINETFTVRSTAFLLFQHTQHLSFPPSDLTLYTDIFNRNTSS